MLRQRLPGSENGNRDVLSSREYQCLLRRDWGPPVGKVCYLFPARSILKLADFFFRFATRDVKGVAEKYPPPLRQNLPT